MKRLYHFETETQTKQNEDASFNRDLSDDKKDVETSKVEE